MANYIVQDTSLTAVANAIRAKAGLSGALVFPTGYAEAVAGIQTGGGTGAGGDGAPVVVNAAPIRVSAAISVAVPSGVEFYYNHQQLPEIPDYIVAEYPYLLLFGGSNGEWRLVASTEKAYYHTEGSGSSKKYQMKVDATAKATVMIRYPGANGWSCYSRPTTGTYFSMRGTGYYAAWWSNYDVPVGDPGAADIYLPASEPKTEKPADPARFYYNGVNLPKIPEDLLAQYPYAWIRENNNARFYDLLMSDTPFYFNSSTMNEGAGAANKPYYRIPAADAGSATEWTNYGEHTYYNYSINSTSTVLWTNHNIPNGSATASSIYLYATPAVPV